MPIPAGPSADLPTITDVKLRLNKTLSVDDAELQTILDAALTEYAAWVAPLPGSVTQSFDGGGSVVVLRSAGATAITAVSYGSGTAISASDLVLDTRTGIVRWGYGTAGQFSPGTRVTITYTVGALPLNHKEIIVADVAGYFEATQRGGASFTPRFAGEGYADPLDTVPGTPAILFPRIRSLAATNPSVA